jgi:hypothetical protein
VILQEEPDRQFYGLVAAPDSAAPSKAAVTHFEPDVIRISLEGQGRWLVLSDIYYPGWTAMVDGKKRPVMRGNYIFRAIPLLPGDRELVLTYDAPALHLGAKVSLTTLIFALALLGLTLFGKPRKDGRLSVCA